MREIQFREALREAMSEEMRRDKSVFLMGEEVAEYHGAYKVSQGMLEEFGADRVIDTPIAELGFAGLGVGAAMNGLKPIIEFMTFNFCLGCDRSDHQLRSQDAGHVRRSLQRSDRVQRPNRECRTAWSHSLIQLRELVCQYPRSESNRSFQSIRCQRPDESRHP